LERIKDEETRSPSFDSKRETRHNPAVADQMSDPLSDTVSGARTRPGKRTMSTPLYGTRPPAIEPVDPAQANALGVSSRLIHLDPGLFALSLLPAAPDRGTGLPAVRVSVPPGPAGRREHISVGAARTDGWMTASDEPTLIRASTGGAEVLLTLYWSLTEATPPSLKLERLNGEPAIAPAAPSQVRGPVAAGGMAAEIVAHVEGVGDVDGRIGEWVGQRGGGRAIEGFSLKPAQDLAVEEFEVRAVLGRDWLSPWLPGGSFCGSRGLALPLRGFCLRLRPQAAARADFAISARFVDGTETGPIGSEMICAAPSLAPLEALRIGLRARTP
jgi:hypothetical protein